MLILPLLTLILMLRQPIHFLCYCLTHQPCPSLSNDVHYRLDRPQTNFSYPLGHLCCHTTLLSRLASILCFEQTLFLFLMSFSVIVHLCLMYLQFLETWSWTGWIWHKMILLFGGLSSFKSSLTCRYSRSGWYQLIDVKSAIGAYRVSSAQYIRYAGKLTMDIWIPINFSISALVLLMGFAYFQ